MYYEERVVNGFLCWRSSPTGEWRPFTVEQLTAMLLSSRDNAAAQRMAH